MSSTDLGIIDQLLFDIGQFIAGVFDKVAQNIQAGFDVVLNGINNLISSITASLQSVVNNLSQVIGDIFGKIEDFITTTVNQIVAFIDEILSDIIQGITSLIDQATRFLQDLTSDIVAFIEGLIQRATDFLRDLFDDVVSAILDIVDKVKALFTDIFDKIVTEIQLIVDRVKLFFGDIFDLVAGGINTVITNAGNVVGSITRAIEDFIASVVDVVGASLRDLLETISDLPATLVDLSTAIVESAKENIGGPIEKLQAGIWAGLTEQLTTATGEDRAQIKGVMADVMLSLSTPPQSLEEAATAYRRILPKTPVLAWIVELFAVLQFMTQVTGGVAQASSAKIVQGYGLENPYALMQPADVVRARHFGLLDDDEAITIFRFQGHTPEDATRLLNISELVPPEGELINWWLRELIDDASLSQQLQQSGWSAASIDNIKTAAFFIPPVQDLITMAVREVFTPEVATRFGQFEDFPEDFAKFAKQQGISEDWARNYWGAHWALPSVQMGFEMLHRGVIEQSDLALLLRASDVMPFWRDKLIDISFSPLTRVDIRRMHKVGVLTLAEVNKAYHDIGYSDDNAQRLTDFTAELNKERVLEDDTDLTQLTRSNIVGLFKDGVFTQDVAQSLLEGIGLSAAASGLFLESAVLELERQRRKDEIAIILDQADFGTITFEEAQDELNALGLETAEIALALTQLRKQQAKRNKLPSQGALDKMVKKGVITKAEYIETVQRLGFSQVWADRLFQLTLG